jgi:hypothetical protein
VAELTAIADRVAKLTTPPFPSAYADPFTTDNKLSDALKAAVAKQGKDWPVAVAIVAYKKGAKSPVAHYRGDEVHYSASLLKVASMYAIYELRKTLCDIAKELKDQTTQKELLVLAGKYLEPHILAKVKTLPMKAGEKGAEVKKDQALPRYADGFEALPEKAGAKTFTVKLLDKIRDASNQGHMHEMIVPSHNENAAACIHVAGYGYLNGALAAGGFLRPGTPAKTSGIWLAGDYLSSYDYFRINSVNDKGVAQAMTALDMARLYTLMWDEKLVDKQSSQEMKEMMALGGAWITDQANGGLDPGVFQLRGNKVGLGPLKTKVNVRSEGTFIRHSSGAEFVWVWQNYYMPKPPIPSWKPIADVLRDTVTAYLAP